MVQVEAARLAVTASYSLLEYYKGYGVGSSMIGPFLTDQAIRLGVEVEQVAYVFSISGIMSILTSLVNGVLTDKFPRYTALLCGVMTCLAGTTIAARSYMTSYAVFFVMALIINFALMGADCIGNSLVIRLWAASSNAPMHLTHSFFGVGSVVGPFIAGPFLSPDFESNDTTCVSNSTRFRDCSSMETPFLIVGVVMVLGGVALIILHLLAPPSTLLLKVQQPTRTILEALSPKSCQGDGSLFVTVLLLLFFGLYYFFLMGGQFSVSGYFFTYLTEREKNSLSKQLAVIVMGSYNAAFLVGRFAAILIAYKAPIQPMLITEAVISAVAAIGLAIFAADHEEALWVFLLLIGAFSAPLWPSGIAWLNRYLNVTSTTFFVLTLGFGLGNFFFNWLIGYFFQQDRVEDLLYIPLACYLTLLAIALVMQLIGSKCTMGKLAAPPEDLKTIDTPPEYLKTTDTPPEDLKTTDTCSKVVGIVNPAFDNEDNDSPYSQISRL